MYKLYQITNTVNEKSYIGITKLSINERWQVHISNSRKPKYPLHYAIAKYGSELFSITLLEENADRKHISDLEEHTIQRLKTHISENGYNVAKGGYGGDLGTVANDKRKSTVKNLSPEQKQQWTNNLSKVRIGKKHSNQTKEKLSRLQKDRGGYGPENHSIQTKEKISKGNTGKIRSPESIEKYRKAAKIRGAKHFAGKKISCLCCNREWDLGNFTQHIRKNK